MTTQERRQPRCMEGGASFATRPVGCPMRRWVLHLHAALAKKKKDGRGVCRAPSGFCFPGPTYGDVYLSKWRRWAVTGGSVDAQGGGKLEGEPFNSGPGAERRKRAGLPAVRRAQVGYDEGWAGAELGRRGFEFGRTSAANRKLET
ncbi:hypothetical protein PG997_011453 [Apiospora hydei]|uniref:Uncharacterized protein n=1 Tax=Apiospora hydei TaxID=1337664 RepID=A0ABR1VJ57_9PEZI